MRQCSRMALMAALAIGTFAEAQSRPDDESGPPIVTAFLSGRAVEMRDNDTHEAILLPKGHTLYRDIAKSGLKPEFAIDPKPNGFDLHCYVHNPSSEPKTLGSFFVGIFTVGQRVHYRDFKFNGQAREFVAGERPGETGMYPEHLYSPAFVFQNDRYSIGASVQYPILEYKHEVLINFQSPGHFGDGEGGRGFEVEFRFSPFGDEHKYNKWRYPAVIGPGERREYTISIRVTRHVDDWLSTLLPYRAYFQRTYGGVQYTRTGYPIRCLNVASSDALSDTNRYGFTNARRRPDINGWRPWIDYIRANTKTWPAVMVWTPTGLYYNNRNLNFPTQFASELNRSAEMREAFNPVFGFPSLRREGKEIGLWWGHSSKYADRWDPDRYEDFDPDKPEHYAAHLKELTAAAGTGATLIGLDTFNHSQTPLWKEYAWLQDMRRRFPQTRFIIEPIGCDILHTVASLYVEGFKDVFDPPPTRIEDLYMINDPFYLADFMLPGHETIGSMSYRAHMRYFGIIPTSEMVTRDMERFVSLGYVPAAFVNVELKRRVRLEPLDPPRETERPHLGPQGGCPGDFNGDGVLDARDVLAFRRAYADGDLRADLDGSGSLDVRDFFALQRSIATGCPAQP